MRVFILALDGLEHDLVVKWRLKNLQQVRYGKFVVKKEYYHEEAGVPFSPKVWVSLITGRKPSEHGIRDWWTYGKILDRIRYLPLIRHIKNKRKVLWKLGIRPRIVNRRDLRITTLFDKVKPSVAVNVPGYNDPTVFYERLKNAFYRGVNEYAKEIWRVHADRVRATFKALENTADWRLFMTYFDLADLIGHIFFVKKRLAVMRAYLELNSLAKKLQERVPDDTIFLIISDHGMQISTDRVTGNHSDHAFWSLNREGNWKPKDFIDIHRKVLEWVRN